MACAAPQGWPERPAAFGGTALLSAADGQLLSRIGNVQLLLSCIDAALVSNGP